MVPLQFFTNDFGIKRGGNSFDDEDIKASSEPEQNFRGFNQPGPKRWSLTNCSPVSGYFMLLFAAGYALPVEDSSRLVADSRAITAETPLPHSSRRLL